jgi:hypothetical protein
MCSKMLLELSDQDIQIKTVIYSINNCNFTSHYNFNNRYFTESNPAVAEVPVCAETSLPKKKKFNQIRHNSKCHPETTRFDHETMVRLVKIARPSRCKFRILQQFGLAFVLFRTCTKQVDKILQLFE